MGNQTLLISHDVVGEQMAGPGIRYYHLARILAQHVPTTLAVPDPTKNLANATDFAITEYNPTDWSTLAPLVEAADICLMPSDSAGRYPQIGECDVYVIIDGYDPLLAEHLAHQEMLPPGERLPAWRKRMTSLTAQYRIGDFYICASERQRDWWLGLLEAHGRVNPATYGHDPSLRTLVDVVAYGLPEATPQRTRPVVRERWPNIHQDDRLILWGGGLWSWLDPLSAIRAVARIHAERPEVKLLFPGTRHPNPNVLAMSTHLTAARDLARQLGLYNKAIFFGDWVAYADWQYFLLECDVALSLHFDTLETRLAYRSRMLEYVWAGLPIVASPGDATSEMIEAYGLGRVVPVEDVDGIADAIQELLDQPREVLVPNFAQARAEHTWERVTQPLVAFCQNPRRAPDKALVREQYYDPDPSQHLRQERDYWQRIAEAYERGRFIRLMKWMQQQKRRISS